MKLAVLFVLLFAVPCAAQVQVDTVRLNGRADSERERYFIEAGAMTMNVQLGRAYFARLRYATQPESGFNILWGLTVMTNSLEGQYTYTEYSSYERTEHTGVKTHRDMFYTGVYFEYLIGSHVVTPYIGAGAVLGLYGSDNICRGDAPCESGFMLGLEPEVGLQLRPFNFMHFRAGYGTLLAVVPVYGSIEPNGALSFALRWLF